MVSTNIFGRGIDIERVNVVFNYDMPDGADTYLHRVGRAGRFGTKGLAISFISSTADAQVLNDVQERFAVEVPDLPDTIDSSTYSTWKTCCPRCFEARSDTARSDEVSCERSGASRFKVANILEVEKKKEISERLMSHLHGSIVAQAAAGSHGTDTAARGTTKGGVGGVDLVASNATGN